MAITPIHTFEQTSSLLATIPYALTAAAGTDNTLINGEILDRYGYDEAILIMAISGNITATTANTIAMVIVVNDSEDSTFATSTSFATLATKTYTSTTQDYTVNDCIVWQFPLQGAKRYIKVNATCDASGGSTTVVYSSVVVLSCATETPSGQADETTVTLA